eukprot:3030336-Rhodomonas_salina.1
MQESGESAEGQADARESGEEKPEGALSCCFVREQSFQRFAAEDEWHTTGSKYLQKRVGRGVFDDDDLLKSVEHLSTGWYGDSTDTTGGNRTNGADWHGVCNSGGMAALRVKGKRSTRQLAREGTTKHQTACWKVRTTWLLLRVYSVHPLYACSISTEPCSDASMFAGSRLRYGTSSTTTMLWVRKTWKSLRYFVASAKPFSCPSNLSEPCSVQVKRAIKDYKDTIKEQSDQSDTKTKGRPRKRTKTHNWSKPDEHYEEEDDDDEFSEHSERLSGLDSGSSGNRNSNRRA